MAKIAVLSNEAQYKAFLSQGLRPQDFLIYSDNEKFHYFLRSKGLDFAPLDELFIRDQWSEIHAWACARAAGWITLGRDENRPPSYDFLSVIHLPFSLILTLMLKNYTYAYYLMEQHAPEEVVIFESTAAYIYPDFSGNDFLNQFLSEISAKRGVRKVILSVNYKDESASLGASHEAESTFDQTLRKILKKIIQKIRIMFTRPGKDLHFVVCGALRHLEETILKLKKEGAKVFLYDFEFNMEQYQFAKIQQIPYYTPDLFPNQAKVDSQAFADDFLSRMNLATEQAATEHFFVYRSYDFGAWIKKNIISKMRPYAVELSRQANQYQNLLSVCPLRGALLDEDVSARAFLAAFMNANQVPVFCASHANIALDYSVPAEYRIFSPSWMFVNSEHEKKGYIERGWDEKRILVTGLPRYDQMAVRLSEKKPHRMDRLLRILFCAGALWPVTPETWGHLGCKIYALKEIQTLTIKALIEAMKGLPIELIIKPHYSEDEPVWDGIISQVMPSRAGKIKIVKHSDDFIDWLISSDAMALSYWSSALLEAGTCGVPVIYVDLKEQKSSRVKEFLDDGFGRIVTDLSSLRNELEELSRWRDKNKTKEISKERREYYLGKRDGKSVERIADSISKILKTSRRNFVQNA